MNREAQILQALQGELPLAARKALVVELNSIRTRAAHRVATAREVELGKEAAAAHLTPAPTYVRHTSDTDWLGKVGSVRQAPAEIHQQAKSEAGAWMRQVSALARADHEELRVQAVGYAQVWGSQFGELATVARDSFLQTASHLAGVKLAADDEDEPKDDDDSDEAYTEADDDSDGGNPFADTLGSPRSSSLRTAGGDRCGATTQARIGNQTEMTVTCSKPAGHTGDHQGVTLDSDDNAIMYRFSSKTAASPDFKSYPKNRAPGQEWSTTCSVCGGVETGTDYYNGWPSQNAFHNHLFCGHDPSLDYHQDLAIDRYSSRHTAEADGIDSPSPQSQNGYAESTLDDVSVSSAPEDTNMGWIAEGDPNADNTPNGTDTSITASLGVFEAMFMSAKTASFDGVPDSTKSMYADKETFPCGLCGKPATHYAYQEGSRASGTFACDDCIQYFAPGRIVVDASRKVAADPGWLRERVNDPYGTPNRVQGPDGQMVDNPFWTSVDYEDVGDFRVFEKDGQWYAHHRRQNYWMKIKNRAEADTLNGSLDMNASRKAAREGWWPLVPSSKYPGENDLVCPDCGSPDVSISGNNLGRDIITNNLYTSLTCNSCGRRDVLPEKSKNLRGASRKQAEADGIDSPSPQSQNGYAETTLTDVSVGSAPDDTNLGWIADGDPNADDEAAFEAPDNPIANEASRTAAGPAGFWCPKCKKYQSTRTPAQLKAAREHVPNCQGKKESSLDAHFARLVEAGDNDRPAGEAAYKPTGVDVSVNGYTYYNVTPEDIKTIYEHYRKTDPSASVTKVRGSRRTAAEVTRFDDGHSEWKCSRCKATVYRYRGESDVSCDRCGAEYNAAGQQLRDDWRGNMSNYDDEIGDMEGYEIQHANDDRDYSSQPGWNSAYGSINAHFASLVTAGKAYDKGMADGKIGDGIQYNPYPFDSQDGAEWIRGYRDAQGLQPGQKASSKTAGENDRPAGAAPMVDQVTDEPEDDVDMFGGEWVHEGRRRRASLDWDFVDSLSPDEQAALVGTMGFGHPTDLNEGDWTALFSSPEAARWASDFSSRYSSRRQAMHPDDDPSQGPGYLNDAPNLLGDPPGMDPEDYDMFAPELPKQARKTTSAVKTEVVDGLPYPESGGKFKLPCICVGHKGRIQLIASPDYMEDLPVSTLDEAIGHVLRRVQENAEMLGTKEYTLHVYRDSRTASLKTAMPAPADYGVKRARRAVEALFDWSNASKEEQCAEYHRLDKEFATDTRSPLHHDNRCPIHSGDPRYSSLHEAMPAPADYGVKVGDIFYSSWGYDQTNIDFYEVVGLTPAGLRVREIGKKFVAQNGPNGNKVVADPGNYIGETMTKRLQVTSWRDKPEPYFSLNSYSSAYLWDGTPKYETDSAFGH